MINCNEIAIEAEELKLSISKCTTLKASQLQKMVELIIALDECRCSCDDPIDPPVPSDPVYRSFQFENVSDDIGSINLLTTQYLADNATTHTEESLIEGKDITLANVGRLGFVIDNLGEDPLLIYDILNNDITTITFDYIYENGISYFVSKEFYIPSDVYVRFVKQ